MSGCIFRVWSPRRSRLVNRRGFTLSEILLAFGLAMALGAMVMGILLWAIRTSVNVAKVIHSQNRALVTGEIIAQYIRNASRIAALDVENGTWVTLEFPDGALGTLVYSNDMPALRDGRIFLVRSNETIRLVTRGVTGIQTSSGFSPPFFSSPRADVVRLRYRITDPVTEDGREVVNDGLYASEVDLWVKLRNAVTVAP